MIARAGPSVSDVFSNSPGKDFVLKPFQELIRASSRAHLATPYFAEAHDVLAAAKAGKPIELLDSTNQQAPKPSRLCLVSRTSPFALYGTFSRKDLHFRRRSPRRLAKLD